MPMWQPMAPTFWTAKEFTQYPLFMVTPHPSYRLHDGYDANPMFGDISTYKTDPLHSGDAYQARLYISPEDANARGIVDGDMVKVFNDSGQALLTAMVLPIFTPGVVAIPEGRWDDLNNDGQDTRGCTNNLTYSAIIGEQKGEGYKHFPAGSWVGHSPVQVELCGGVR